MSTTSKAWLNSHEGYEWLIKHNFSVCLFRLAAMETSLWQMLCASELCSKLYFATLNLGTADKHGAVS